MADVWWMENGSELCDELTKERDEARAEVARLRSVMAERDTLSARVRQLQDEALDVAECRRLANVAVDQAEAARSKLRSVTEERDAARERAAYYREWQDKVTTERDEALALLSKAREAWARFAASDRLYHAYPCYHRVPVGGQTLPGAACTCGLADLAKILRTGETT